MKKVIAITFMIALMSFRFQHQIDDVFGMEIKGDFNGDKMQDQANTGPIRQFHFDRNTDGIGWMVKFSDEKIPELTLGCCLSYLINEGDLNKDGSDELSIYAFSGDQTDCAYSFSTYTLEKAAKSGNKPVWKKILGPFAIAKGCEGYTANDLLSRVIMEKDGSVYYRVDTNGTTLKKKAF